MVRLDTPVPAHISRNVFASTSLPHLPFQRKTARRVQSMICFYEAGPLPAKDFVIFADSGLEDEKNKNTPCIRACMLLQDVFDMIFQLKLIFYIRRGGLSP